MTSSAPVHPCCSPVTLRNYPSDLVSLFGSSFKTRVLRIPNDAQHILALHHEEANPVSLDHVMKRFLPTVHANAERTFSLRERPASSQLGATRTNLID